MSAPSSTAGLNLFVANLSPDVTDELFRATFADVGPVLSAKVMLDIHTGISRGFGFVLFQNEEDGMRALTELQGKPLGKRDSPMVITRAQTTGHNAILETPKIHLRNVPITVSEPELMELLSHCGKVERLVLKEDKSDSSNRSWVPASLCVFVQFSKASEAQAAVDKFHNSKPWPDMVVPLMAKPAETPEMRSERKQRQEMKRSDHRKAGSGSMSGSTTTPQGQVLTAMPMAFPQQQPMQQQQTMQFATGLGPGQIVMVPQRGFPTNGGMGQRFPGFADSVESYSLTSSFGNSWNFSQPQPPMLIPQYAPPMSSVPMQSFQAVQHPNFQAMAPPPGHHASSPYRPHMAPNPPQPVQNVPFPLPAPNAAVTHGELVPMIPPMHVMQTYVSSSPQQAMHQHQAMQHQQQAMQHQQQAMHQQQAGRKPNGAPGSPLVPSLGPTTQTVHAPQVNVFEQSLESLSGSTHSPQHLPPGTIVLNPTVFGEPQLQQMQPMQPMQSQQPQYVVLIDPQRRM